MIFTQVLFVSKHCLYFKHLLQLQPFPPFADCLGDLLLKLGELPTATARGFNITRKQLAGKNIRAKHFSNNDMISSIICLQTCVIIQVRFLILFN